MFDDTQRSTFLYRQNSVDYRMTRLRNSLYRRLTKRHLPLFFRGGDTISAQPLTNGVYEPDTMAQLEHYADAGHSDFLIDIGANIGLSSCQSGRKFRELHLYEPNPDVLSILKVNMKIMMAGHNYHIHEYGLGDESNVLRFCVPHNNWGGAFVMGKGNAYSEQTQAAKDGHAEFDPSKYSIGEVKIEAADRVLKDLFDSLASRNMRSGVIKIDVEGCEMTVLNAIANTLPSDFRAAVIFENWSEEVNYASVLEALRGRGKLFNLVTEKHPIKLLPRWMNAIMLLIRGHIDTVLVPNDASRHIGGLVLEIQRQ